MKNLIKKLSVFIAAMCAATAGVSLLGACGEESPDFTTYTYADWEQISYSDWNSKKISYQFATPTEPENRINGAVKDVYAEVLINLYSDGSLLILQAGLYETEEMMPDAVWFDRSNHISWAQFGVWEKDESSLKLYYFCCKSADDTTVKPTAEWAENDFCYCVEMTETSSGSGVYEYIYSYNSTDGTGNYIQMFGTKLADDDDENGHIKTGLSQSKTGNDIEFATIEDWIATYNDETFGIA